MLLIESQGLLVKKLQQKLFELSYNTGSVDGIFGPRTQRAIICFQRDNNLDIDGVVGDETWKKLFNEPFPQPLAIETPPSQEKCFQIFGDFRIPGWKEQSLVKCDLSEFKEELKDVFFDWMTENDKAFIHNNWFGFMTHKSVASKFQEAFRNVISRGLHKQIKTFGGCFNPRQIRGGQSWSTHSWGIAIDINPKWNRFGQKNFEMSENLARCFEDIGFVWGGRWTGFPDAMHFQYATVR
ncbi:MAG: M15 family metallopeptidase [Patescibacteria group bacterium]|nr:M15 family metallopeptidase [Patescibacteria group bacterium]MDD5294757.1 M15 family metallopeptidase [Patescibacteria group bacterium]MDD5554698.1 M15 family metallopeptidase [Patescibacteria group bacterium]